MIREKKTKWFLGGKRSNEGTRVYPRIVQPNQGLGEKTRLRKGVRACPNLPIIQLWRAGKNPTDNTEQACVPFSFPFSGTLLGLTAPWRRRVVHKDPRFWLLRGGICCK